MRASRILVVDDSEVIRVAVETALTEHGFDVTARPDGASFEDDLRATRPDLVILDVMMPGRDGFELLAVARRESAAGVLMLTARDAMDDRLNGLRRGADDYLVKPFAMAELVARTHAILRRLGGARSRRVVGDLLLDDDGAVVRRGEHLIALTRTERRLLDVLAEHSGTVLSKTQILNAVWGIDERADNLVEINISSLRRKLEAAGPRVIHTIRGLGYVLSERSPDAS
ncbi:MAG TPA: response regulator transcription factor [Actinopolymorphaceae bacterium]